MNKLALDVLKLLLQILTIIKEFSLCINTYYKVILKCFGTKITNKK